MPRLPFFASTLLAVSMAVSANRARAQNAGDVIPGQYLIELKSGAAPAAVSYRHGLAPKFTYSRAANGIAGAIPPGRMRALQADPDVISITPDRVVSANGKPGPAPTPAPQVVPAGVQRIGAAPGALAYTGNGVGVAVVDTGLDFNHNDLKPFGAVSFTAFQGTAQDDNDHGTHVGGIIAARNNQQDVVGVAPQATLYSVKVLASNGSGSDANVIAGLEWVANNAALVTPKIRVVNMSLGRPGTLNDAPLLRSAVQALKQQNITVVVSAGNDSSLEVNQNVPATYPEVLAIASTTALNGTNEYRFFNGVIGADTASYFTTDGRLDSFTNIGVTVSAPGESRENISRTGMISSVGILSTKRGGGTIGMSGTSMSAPHVTGVVALMWQKALQSATTLTPADAQIKLIGSAFLSDVAPYGSPTNGYTFDDDLEGVVSAAGALQ